MNHDHSQSLVHSVATKSLKMMTDVFLVLHLHPRLFNRIFAVGLSFYVLKPNDENHPVAAK
jgi:hypothetical protein